MGSQDSPDLDRIRADLIARRFPISYDYLDPRNSYLLDVTLSDYLPKGNNNEPYSKPHMPCNSKTKLLPPAHHLVYFLPTIPDSRTLPDGTDPEQSPGKPFTRRMWAGGEMYFSNDSQKSLRLDGSRVACVERIADLAIKGHPGNEKLFVKMERLMGTCEDNESDDSIRERFDAGEGLAIREIRNIFFTRPPPEGHKPAAPKPIKPQHESTFSHTLTPTSKLLFRYSALTFNTHAIHRDPLYVRDVEGYPDLIFHGPLSFTFLTTLLRHHLAEQYPDKFVAIKEIKYRNTHPLYCDEQIKVCGRKRDHEGDPGTERWEMWEENSQGNIAVMYDAVVEEVAGDMKPNDVYDDIEEMMRND